MSLIRWNDAMSVGVEKIDADHKKLVEMINTLFDGVHGGHGREAVGDILDGLIRYTVEHFDREEQIFAKTAYPGAAEHKAEHDALKAQVLEIQKKYMAGTDSALTLETMAFLKHWLIDHIQGLDKKYSEHVQSHGIH